MNTKSRPKPAPFLGCPQTQRGSVLVVAIIVLAILGALGVASLNVADTNLRIAQNSREATQMFFLADSGANMGHEHLTLVGNDFNSASNPVPYQSPNPNFTLNINATSNAPGVGVVIRSGSSVQLGNAYGSSAGSGITSGVDTVYLITSTCTNTITNATIAIQLGWRDRSY